MTTPYKSPEDYDRNLPLLIIHPKATSRGENEWMIRTALMGHINVIISEDAPEDEALFIPASEIDCLVDFTLMRLMRKTLE